MSRGEDADLVRLPDGRRAQIWQGGASSGPAVIFQHGCPDSRLAARTGDTAARRAGVRLVVRRTRNVHRRALRSRLPARHPDRAAALAAVASPATRVHLDPRWHRDDLSPTQQAVFGGIAASTVAEGVELARPEFDEYVAGVAPEDHDDIALARRWTKGLHPLDVRLLPPSHPRTLQARPRRR